MPSKAGSEPSQGQTLSRRTLFAGASTVGALAAVAALAPRTPTPADTPEPQQAPRPTRGGGYTLSERVQQYYKTTRI